MLRLGWIMMIDLDLADTFHYCPNCKKITFAEMACARVIVLNIQKPLA
jgi:hypothetical protein